MNESLKSNLFTLARIHKITKTQNGVEGINQKAVEDKTGVAQTTLSGLLEQGKAPRIDTLQRLATGLNVEVWQLLAPPAVFKASLTPNFPDLIEVLSRQQNQQRKPGI